MINTVFSSVQRIMNMNTTILNMRSKNQSFKEENVGKRNLSLDVG